MGYIYPMVFLLKQAQKLTFDFNTSSERPLSKLSENHKINVIGPVELKVMAVQRL